MFCLAAARRNKKQCFHVGSEPLLSQRVAQKEYIEKIRKQLIGIGVDLSYPIITLCGSGMTACILNFVLDIMNHDQHSLYDGSWSEWGAEKLYPGEDSIKERPVEKSTDK